MQGEEERETEVKEEIEKEKEVGEEEVGEKELQEVHHMSSKLQEIKIDDESLNIMEKISIHDGYFDDLRINEHISPINSSSDEWDIL